MLGLIQEIAFYFAALSGSAIAQPATAQESETAMSTLPTVRFFYYDAGSVEWASSEESRELDKHLIDDDDSLALIESLTSAVNGPPAVEQSMKQMNEWIETERRRFEESRRDMNRIRVAEGIIAYMRTHDFNISKLVEDLKRRSGANEVQLAAIHTRNLRGESSFYLKVILVEPEIEIGQQGFNVTLRSPTVGYASVTYALGVALYEVHEILNRNVEGEDLDDGRLPEGDESMPLPAPLEGPELSPPQANLTS